MVRFLKHQIEFKGKLHNNYPTAVLCLRDLKLCYV